MLFNSSSFLFLFLPVVLCVYFWFGHHHFWRARAYWLLGTSLFFYSHWEIRFLPLLLFSIVVNYLTGKLLQGPKGGLWLTLGICFNLALLAYFKYSIFFLENINFAFGTHYSWLKLLLPLGISFYTFQQIAFLIDCRSQRVSYAFHEYAIFVCFFPQLVAGPILHHSEFLPQFRNKSLNRFNPQNFYRGLYYLSLGLFKKLIIADQLAILVNQGFHAPQNLAFFGAWVTALSFTFQLYFDFGGYSDMAIGLGLMFNFKFPRNFANPYQATSLQDFWARWHITLTRWFEQYLYYPLALRLLRFSDSAVFKFIPHLIVFTLIGFWHGATWGFIIFGLMHGLGLTIQQASRAFNLKIPVWIGWPLTFIYLIFSWVFFRAGSLTTAFEVVRRMLGLSGIEKHELFSQTFYLTISNLNNVQLAPNWVANFPSGYSLLVLGFAMLLAFCFDLDRSKTSTLEGQTEASTLPAYIYGIAFGLSIFVMSIMIKKEFFYFRF